MDTLSLYLDFLYYSSINVEEKKGVFSVLIFTKVTVLCGIYEREERARENRFVKI